MSKRRYTYYQPNDKDLKDNKTIMEIVLSEQSVKQRIFHGLMLMI